MDFRHFLRVLDQYNARDNRVPNPQYDFGTHPSIYFYPCYYLWMGFHGGFDRNCAESKPTDCPTILSWNIRGWFQRKHPEAHEVEAQFELGSNCSLYSITARSHLPHFYLVPERRAVSNHKTNDCEFDRLTLPQIQEIHHIPHSRDSLRSIWKCRRRRNHINFRRCTRYTRVAVAFHCRGRRNSRNQSNRSLDIA